MSNNPFEALDMIRRINEMRMKIRKLPADILAPKNLAEWLDSFDELEEQTISEIDSCLRSLIGKTERRVLSMEVEIGQKMKEAGHE